METLLIITIIILAVIIVLGLVYIIARGKKDKPENTEFKIMREQMVVYEEKLNNATKELVDRLNEQNKIIVERMDKSQESLQKQFFLSQKDKEETNKLTSQILKEVTEKLTKVEDTNKQVVNFAEQMQSLENILKNPKQRGILGEYFLETTLKNVLPPSTYQMQYKFKDGVIVDAVVFVKEKVIPIDSKFSLENYNKILEEKDPIQKEKLEKIFKADLKNRIEETAKYIRPDEGTMDFAFMFIPSEGIYYDLLINQVGAVKVNTRDLIQYAFAEKKVIIVSPTSFLAYLQTVLQGLRSLQIEESAMQILENVRKLQSHIQAYEENFDKLGKHLGTTVNTYNKAHKELGKIDKDFLKITGDNLAISSEEVQIPLED